MKPDMFASNNSTEINQIVLDHVSPSSMEEPQQNSYLHFPDPFLDDDDLFLSHFLSGQQQLFSGGDCWEEQEQEQEHVHDQTKQNSDKARIEVMKKKKKCSSNRKIGSSTKRTGKKDRHSKICTAQGPRDRRMRLSLQIARKFFDLQDMLGFDKASKTIEWLLSNSNSAIKDLKDSLNNNNNNISGHSYGSVCSGSSEVVSEIIRDNNNAGGGATAKEAAFMGTLKDKKSRPLRTVARESRDRARARARQRTILKRTEQQQQPQPISNSEDQNPCFDFQHVNSELQEQTHFQDCPTIRIDHKVFAISDDLSDFPSIHSFFSGNNNTQLQNLDYPTLSCPNSIFMASPISKPYSFSDTTLLKLP